MITIRILGAVLALSASLLAQTPNPVPFITQPLIPASAAPGGPGFTLTVNGTGFVPGSVINWNGNPRSTAFINPSQLQASVPPSDVTTARTAWVTVSNPEEGVSNVVFFPIGSSTGTVSFARRDFSLAPGVQGLATADFNHDGKLDLAINAFNPSTGNYAVYVLLGNGDGTFTAPVKYDELGFDGEGVPLVGDFNGDGNPDLVLEGRSNEVDVLLGNGDGTFQSPRTTFTAGPTPQVEGIATPVDLNGDGKLDIVVSTVYGISVLLGNGDGTFDVHDYILSTRTNFSNIAVGDFNGDGKLDVAVGALAPGASAGNLWVLLGNGDGTFGSPTNINFNPGEGTGSLLVADLNGDGKLDLISPNGITVSVFLGNRDGTFQPEVDYPAGLEPVFATLGDFNSDEKLDLAIANVAVVTPTSSSVSILLGNGDGSFQPPTNFAAGVLPNSLSVGDFNADGRLDLAVGNFQSDFVSVLLGISGDFTISASPASQTIPSGHSATYAISLAPEGGLIGTVSLSCSGGPPNSTCTVSPSSIASNGTATVKVVLSRPMNVNHGTFALTITGTLGDLIHSTDVTLKVK